MTFFLLPLYSIGQALLLYSRGTDCALHQVLRVKAICDLRALQSLCYKSSTRLSSYQQTIWHRLRKLAHVQKEETAMACLPVVIRWQLEGLEPNRLFLSSEQRQLLHSSLSTQTPKSHMAQAALIDEQL